MNPSAQDWIPKYIDRFGSTIISSSKNKVSIYNKLLEIGFIYGVSLTSVIDEPISAHTLTKEEVTKINLFHALLHVYFTENPEGSFDIALQSINNFYAILETEKKGFFQKLKFKPSKTQNIEAILSARLQESNTLFKKNSISVLTYALLYIDVLSFKQWIQQPSKAKAYSESLEQVIINSCFLALNSKKKKNKYDKLLIELFESSSDYLNLVTHKETSNTLHQVIGATSYGFEEKKYLLDICCIALWNDEELDETEITFLKNLLTVLNLPEKELTHSTNVLLDFSGNYAKELKLFEYAGPVKLFYKQSTETVKLLVLRNKKRLIKELDQSGELLLLLSQSTIRDLDKSEKQKVKEQLLDICKTIPSLTIFLLPGGTLLLPLLAKLIPQLLPSSFNENKLDS